MVNYLDDMNEDDGGDENDEDGDDILFVEH